MLWGKDLSFPHNLSQGLTKSKKNFSRQGASPLGKRSASRSLRIAPEKAKRRRSSLRQAAFEEQRSIGEFFKDLLFLVFALLIRNTARSLASRLARGLALAATAVLCGLAKILSIKCLNTLHSIYPPINIDCYCNYITDLSISQAKR